VSGAADTRGQRVAAASRGAHRRRADGFVLISVLLAISLLAALVAALNLQAGGNLSGDAELRRQQLDYLLQAGAGHAQWLLANAGCAAYALPEQRFGTGSYSASFSPQQGSPVRLQIKAALDDGPSGQLLRDAMPAYQPGERLLLDPGAALKEAYIHESNSDHNHGDSDHLRLDDDDSRYYALIEFDLDALPEQSHVSSAQLGLSLQSLDGDGGEDGAITAYRLLQPWSESEASWDQADDGRAWSWPAAYDAVAPVARVDFAGASPGQRYRWDITELLRGWHSGRYPNHGLVLIASGGIDDARFASGDAKDPQLRPRLQIDHACECGRDCGRQCGAGSYRDDFAAASYGNHDGELSWAGDWRERDGAGGGATGGDVYIESGRLQLSDNAAAGAAIERALDLSAAAYAVLEMVAARSAFDDPGSDGVLLEISADGGGSWSLLEDFAAQPAGASLRRRYDIGAWRSADTRLRLRVHSGYSQPDEHFSVERLRVRTACAPIAAQCDANYLPDAFIGGFSTAALSDGWGLSYLPGGTRLFGAAVPAAGGWLLVDSAAGRLSITDFDGNPLGGLDVSLGRPTGAAWIDTGPWAGHLAVGDESSAGVYLLDAEGQIRHSFSTLAFTDRPLGMDFISNTASWQHDGLLLISSDRDRDGAPAGGIHISDFDGQLRHSRYAQMPENPINGVAHLPGSDLALLVSGSRLGMLMDLTFGSNGSYATGDFGITAPRGVDIEPGRCDQTILGGDSAWLRRLNRASETSYLDRLIGAGYSGSDGRLDWSVGWLESGESDGPQSGELRVADSVHCASGRCLRIGGEGDGTAREIGARQLGRAANLNTSIDPTSSAWLSFELAAVGSGGGRLDLQVSDGGGSWVTLDSFTLDGSLPVVPTRQQYDVLDYASSDFQLRFSFTGNLPATGLEALFIDDVAIDVEFSTAPSGDGGDDGGGSPPPPGPDPGACVGDYADNFVSASYSNSDGSLNWDKRWVEVAEGDGPSAGDIRIGRYDGRNVLRLKDNGVGNGEGIYRPVDLSGYSGSPVTLGFDYRRSGFDNANDWVAVQVSADGGANWDELLRLSGPASDSTSQLAEVDLSRYAGSSVRLRLMTSPRLGNLDALRLAALRIVIGDCP